MKIIKNKTRHLVLFSDLNRMLPVLSTKTLEQYGPFLRREKLEFTSKNRHAPMSEVFMFLLSTKRHAKSSKIQSGRRNTPLKTPAVYCSILHLVFFFFSIIKNDNPKTKNMANRNKSDNVSCSKAAKITAEIPNRRIKTDQISLFAICFASLAQT